MHRTAEGRPRRRSLPKARPGVGSMVWLSHHAWQATEVRSSAPPERPARYRACVLRETRASPAARVPRYGTTPTLLYRANDPDLATPPSSALTRSP